jgi:hypothetical protein
VGQSPSRDTDTRSACQEITRLIWNSKVHYRVHKNPPLGDTLRPISPIIVFIFYFFVFFAVSRLVSSHQVFWLKWVHFSFCTFVLHVLLISPFFVWSL